MRKALSIGFVVILLGCVDSITLNLDSGGNVLVVDGLITTDPGPYVITLSRSVNFSNERPLRVYTIPEPGAQLLVSDDQGFSEVLDSVGPGKYSTINLKGEIGKKYLLKIVTKDGSEYSSSQEELLPAPEIESLDYEFRVYDRLFVNSYGDPRILKSQGFFISAVVNDPPDEENNYRWQIDGIFEFFSLTDHPEIKQCWAPLYRLEAGVGILSDQTVNGHKFSHHIAIVPYERNTDFLVKVRQQSLSRGAYMFWKRIQDQQLTTGGIFDQPPTPVLGNVVNNDNIEELVLGYFGASHIVRKEILIDRWVASGYVRPAAERPILPGDCTKHEPEATNVKPPGF